MKFIKKFFQRFSKKVPVKSKMDLYNEYQCLNNSFEDFDGFSGSQSTSATKDSKV